MADRDLTTRRVVSGGLWMPLARARRVMPALTATPPSDVAAGGFKG